MKPTNLHIYSMLLILLLPVGKIHAQPEWMKGRLDINVAVSGAPLYAFIDNAYGAEHFYHETAFLKSLYTGNIKSRTYGFYSVDAAYRMSKRWAVLLNAGYSNMTMDFHDPHTHEHLKRKTDNFIPIMAGCRYYWKDKPAHKIYTSLYMGIMLHDRESDYWKTSNYDNDLFAFQVTFIGWQFGKGKIYGLAEFGSGELYMGIPVGMRLGAGYRF